MFIFKRFITFNELKINGKISEILLKYNINTPTEIQSIV